MHDLLGDGVSHRWLEAVVQLTAWFSDSSEEPSPLAVFPLYDLLRGQRRGRSRSPPQGHVRGPLDFLISTFFYLEFVFPRGYVGEHGIHVIRIDQFSAFEHRT